MQSKLAIVILNWNGKRFLEKFLPTLLAQTPDWAQVVVADNASSDHSIEFLQANYPTVKIIRNGENFGFAKGYNIAFSQIDCDYYCLLNSDIEVTPQWVEPVIALMDSDPQIAAVQPKIRSYSDRSRFEYAGAAGGFIDRYGYPFCRGRVFETVEKDENQYDSEMDVFWATGAALFVRSTVYHEAGGLDDDFFAHMEEIDLCWRIKNLGYRIVIAPRSVVYHVGGGTLPKNNSFKTFLNFRNNHFLLLKNLPERRLLPTICVRILLDNVAAFVFLLQGHAKDFVAVYRAHFALVRQYRKFSAKRAQSAGNNFAAYQDVYHGSILVNYHLKRQHYYNGIRFFKK